MAALIIGIVLIVWLVLVITAEDLPYDQRPLCNICGKPEGIADQHGFICMTCAGWNKTS